ncbi:hypothetical protein COL5a_002381 [Colletotrichum fioriniae]|nr:uncharacterized protein COL516b_001908 [Colletotrichum fioriniae]KAJ0311203.1 hypothetical protein COL516b_001908 [Colletotrichum fioriniae]KAJ0331714.1 hypothetical protein COL5a_002381 [Colletotrichum fioriniae]
MKGPSKAIGGVLATLVGLTQANSDIVSLFTNGAAYIQEASATLVLPKLPSSVSGDVAIWSAIMMENQASFLQGVTSNSPSSNPTVGDPVTASPGSTIRTHYKLNSATNLWDQDVYIDNKLASSVSTSWEDVSIVLSQADQSFGHTGGWEHGATGGDMSSPDGGKTWNFSTLNIPTQKAE